LTLPQNQRIAKQLHEKYHSLSLMLVKGPAAAKTGIFPAESQMSRFPVAKNA
jgi:hypothetical protein